MLGNLIERPLYKPEPSPVSQAREALPLQVTEVGMAGAGSRERVRERRARLLRPVQIWVPDVNAAWFAEEAQRQSRALAASEHARRDQAYVDSISQW
jgi:hypothetical protein